MELLLSEEQRLLQDSVAGTLTALGGVKRTRALRNKNDGFDREVLARMGTEGWLGALVPADAGGLGLGPTELGLVLEQVGRQLAPEPVATVSLAAWALAGVGQSWADELKDRLIAGRTVVASAFDGSRIGGLGSVAEDAASAPQQMDVNGTAQSVPFADAAEGHLIEVASIGMVYAEAANPSQISCSRAATVDGRSVTTMTMTGAKARALPGGEAMAARLFDLSLLMASAELVGVMSAALDMTVDYLKTRTQFGRPIGSFQALQHRGVDDFTRIVSCRSLLYQVLGQGDRVTSAMAAAVKSHVSGEALTLTKSAIQMHGAIGFTDDHDIGLYLKRAMWLSAYLGNAAVHRRRFAALSAAHP